MSWFEESILGLFLLIIWIPVFAVPVYLLLEAWGNIKK